MTSKKEMDLLFRMRQYPFTKSLDYTVPPEFAPIVDKIINLVQKKDYVSFVEIEKLFEKEGFKYKSPDTAFTIISIHAIVWMNWSQKAFDALRYAMKFGDFCWWPCVPVPGGNPSVYVNEGKTLKLKATSSRDIKMILEGELLRDRWFPIVFVRKDTWYNEFIQKEAEDKKCQKH